MTPEQPLKEGCKIQMDRWIPNILKKKFGEEPVLIMPDQTKPFQIKTNASKYASRAVLTQTNMNNEWHLIAFLSKTFTETEETMMSMTGNCWQLSGP